MKSSMHFQASDRPPALQIPVHQHSQTEVHLFATAGFRVLAPRPAAELINSCRTLLAASRFKFRDEWASVMSGTLDSKCQTLHLVVV